MKKIEINGKEYKIPQSLHEVSLKQYCKIFNGMKLDKEMEWKEIKYAESKMISRIMGEDDDFALSLPLTVYNMVCEMCTFLYEAKHKKHNDKVKLNGKYYTIPKPNDMNLRQWIDIDVTRQSGSEDMFIELYAILLCEIGEDGKVKEYDGKYEERIKALEDYPSDDAMSMINDFFVKGESSQKLMDAYSKVEEAVNQFAHSTKGS